MDNTLKSLKNRSKNGEIKIPKNRDIVHLLSVPIDRRWSAAPRVKDRNARAGTKPYRYYITFDHLRQLVQGEKISSKRHYFLWWDKLNPLNAPLHPEQVYKEWTSWNDFLGNKNTPAHHRRYRSFDDARQYATDRGFKTCTQYFACDDHPDDIPARPDLVYHGLFLSWPHFLNIDYWNKDKAALHSVIDAQRQETAHSALGKRLNHGHDVLSQRSEQLLQLDDRDDCHDENDSDDCNVPRETVATVKMILLFGQSPYMPSNHYDISTHRTIEGAQDYMRDNCLRLLRSYYFDSSDDIHSILIQYGQGNGNEWSFSNLNELLFVLDTSLDTVR